MKQIFIFLILMSLFVVTISPVMAQSGGNPPGGNPSPVSLPDPLNPDGKPTTHPKPAELIGRIIHAALGIVGSIALAMFIYGGFVWMTAAGSSEKVQKGKDVLIWAALGLVIIFSAYALVKFVIQEAILGG
ncbi:MAG: pilin [Patescibacteria group bacterium]|nr:pilin [Patescibacteria group bacterium]